MKAIVSGNTLKIWNYGVAAKVFTDRIDEIISAGDEILLPYKPGTAFNLIRDYLLYKDYRNVTLYYLSEGRHVNDGNWREKEIANEKDIFQEIGETADYDVFWWGDGSDETLCHMMNFIFLGKKSKLYDNEKDEWLEINSLEALRSLCSEPEGIRRDDVDHVLAECGFSDEMRTYLTDKHNIPERTLIDIICGAPVGLEKKEDMLMELRAKKSLKHEMLNTFRQCMENAVNYRDMNNKMWEILKTQEPDNIYCCIEKAGKEIADVKLLNYLIDESLAQWRTMLFCEWYDTDILAEKSCFSGLFIRHNKMYEYIENEEKDTEDEAAVKELPDWWYKAEVWEESDVDEDNERTRNVYDLYIFNGKVCWFEEKEADVQVNGNTYYLPKSRLHSRGVTDLSLPTPFKSGDIVLIDCRPFGEPFHAMILESRHQYDCCFPNIVFRVPHTDGWRCTALKHKMFYRDMDCGTYAPMLSPLYRLRSVKPEELTVRDSELVSLSRMLKGDENAASDIWNNWHCDDTSFGEVRAIFEKCCKHGLKRG